MPAASRCSKLKNNSYGDSAARYHPRVSRPHSYRFLNEAGAVLEFANLRFARLIRKRHTGDRALDQYLVSSEQRLLQTFLDARGEEDGRPVCRELNAVLNERHISRFPSRAISPDRPYALVLRNVRRELSDPLDFADELHRVRIGMGLIQHIRSQKQTKAHWLSRGLAQFRATRNEARAPSGARKEGCWMNLGLGAAFGYGSPAG